MNFPLVIIHERKGKRLMTDTMEVLPGDTYPLGRRKYRGRTYDGAVQH